MTKPYTIDEVSQYIESYNNFCLSNEYINNMSKLKIRCPKNHIYEISLASFKRGCRCQICAGNKKYNLKEIDEYIHNNDWTLLSSKYKNSLSLLELLCENGHYVEMTFGNFRSGYRCSQCKGLKKHSQKYVDEYLLKNGDFTNTIYTKNKNKLDIICKFGHKFKMSFDCYHNKHQRCNICYFNSISGENHYNWNKDRVIKNRLKYLSFDINKIDILKDEPLYENYIQSQQEAKQSNKNWDRTKYTVDHIYPRKAFVDNNLDKIYELKVIKKICNSRDNLRIITEADNRDKWYKYNQQEFMKWFETKIGPN